MADNRDEVFDDVHYELEFKKDGLMTTVISDDPQTILKFLKCHNLDINLMQNIIHREPNKKKDGNTDFVLIPYQFYSNKYRRHFIIYTNETIYLECVQKIATDLASSMIFGPAIMQTGYDFISRIVDLIDNHLKYGCVLDFDAVEDGLEMNGRSYMESYLFDPDGIMYDVFFNDSFSKFDGSPVPTISLEGYISAFVDLINDVEKQYLYSPN